MMNLRKFLLILTIALVMILAITVWFSPSNEDFRTENPSWNGVKDISAICPTSPVKSLDDLPPSPQGTTLILIPYLTTASLRTPVGYQTSTILTHTW